MMVNFLVKNINIRTLNYRVVSGVPGLITDIRIVKLVT